MRRINTLLEKSGKKLNSTEKLFYQIVKAYVLDKMSKKQEASLQIQGSIKEILDNNITDSHLIDQAEALMVEMGLFDQVLELIQNLQKKNPKEEQLAMKLFNAYCQQNEFQKMSGVCSIIEKQFGHSEYALYSIQALYLYSQQKGVPPNTIDLVIMFLEKQRMTLYGTPDKKPPQYFVQLYYKIMIAKGNYQKAIDYLNQNREAFGMILEQRRLIVKALYQKGDLVGCLNELLSIIKDNQNKIDSYQSIYDIHEFMISLLIRFGSTKGIKEKISSQFICQDLDQSENFEKSQEFQPINEENMILSIKNIFQSFKYYESLDLENKSTNNHNSRKNCLLSQLMIKHKLLNLFSDDQIILSFFKEKKFKNPFVDTILIYAQRYIELSSMIYDLYQFIPYLNQEDRVNIIQQLTNQAQNEQDVNRKARATIGVHKLNLCLNQYNFGDDQVKTFEIVKIMHQDYFKFLDLDGKPEKGERKLGDDMVLLINILLSKSFKGKVDHIVLYRMSLLEFALEQSPYNFDIQVQLVKLYDSLGLSVSFYQNFQGLGCKGVQLESMGFIILRHMLDWGEFGQFKSFMQKYRKYCSKNFSDLKQLKVRSLKENNYDQIENFIEYEKFTQDSLFLYQTKFFQMIIDFSDPNFQEHSKSFFDNMHQTLTNENSLLLNQDQRNYKERSQDIRVILDNYLSVNEYTGIKQPEVQWTESFQKDWLMQEIVGGDKIYSFFKFDRRTNYKENIINSLGVFENFPTFTILSSLIKVISVFKNKMKEENKEVIKSEAFNLKLQLETYQKLYVENNYENKLDTQGWVGQIKQISLIYEIFANQLDISSQMIFLAQSSKGNQEEIGKGGNQIKEKLNSLINQSKTVLQSVDFSQQKSEQEEEKEVKQEFFAEKMKLRCQINLLFGSIYPLILEIFNDSVKSLIPQKKKKKGKQQEQNQLEILNELTSLVKQWQKEIHQFFLQANDIEAINENSRKSQLQQEQQNLDQLKIISSQSEDLIQKIMVRKMGETIKEEKLLKERAREQSQSIAKRLKELMIN